MESSSSSSSLVTLTGQIPDDKLYFAAGAEHSSRLRPSPQSQGLLLFLNKKTTLPPLGFYPSSCHCLGRKPHLGGRANLHPKWQGKRRRYLLSWRDNRPSLKLEKLSPANPQARSPAPLGGGLLWGFGPGGKAGQLAHPHSLGYNLFPSRPFSCPSMACRPINLGGGNRGLCLC